MRTRFDTTYDALGARLRIAGDLDLTTSEGLAAELEAISTTGSTWVELDLDAVTFVDAHSLRLLGREQRRLHELGGGLRVAVASPCFCLISAVAGYPDLQPGAGRPLDLRRLADAALPDPGTSRSG